MDWETEIDIYILLGIKEITNENRLYGTPDSTQRSVVTYTGRKFKEEGVYVYMWLIHFTIQQNTTL